MGAAVRCREPFSAWGRTYAVGDVVDGAAWPDPSAVATRLANGFLEFGVVDDAPRLETLIPSAPPDVDATAPAPDAGP